MSKLVARQILLDIDNYCKTAYDDGFRAHLGGSLIGEECKRKLWYGFRWCVKSAFDGRLLRLFNRGHREEARFIEWLKGIGAQVWAHNEDGSQFRISASGGHFGGSLDGICILPERYGVQGPLLLEFKTNGTGAGFNKLGEDGMPRAKPMHFAQTSTYGSDPAYRFEWCLYMNINKNDDSIHVELVKLDWNLGDQMRAKADAIILSQSPPPRLSNNPTFKSCAYCDMKGVCHEGKPVERNCRSCKHASPRDNKQWYCDVNADFIPVDFIKVGCQQHQSINQNI